MLLLSQTMKADPRHLINLLPYRRGCISILKSAYFRDLFTLSLDNTIYLSTMFIYTTNDQNVN
jgi:hypothetical protein